MFQPFVKMNFKMIEGFAQLGKIYHVTQTYPRGNEIISGALKEGILFSDYDDKGIALNHKDAIRNNKYAAVVDLSKPEHKEKVLRMIRPDSQYSVYWNAVMNRARMKYILDHEHREELKLYVDTQTNWMPGRNEVVHPDFEIIFGEIFITFNYRGRKQRAKIDEVTGL